jgi:hypothetical protein
MKCPHCLKEMLTPEQLEKRREYNRRYYDRTHVSSRTGEIGPQAKKNLVHNAHVDSLPIIGKGPTYGVNTLAATPQSEKMAAATKALAGIGQKPTTTQTPNFGQPIPTDDNLDFSDSQLPDREIGKRTK